MSASSYYLHNELRGLTMGNRVKIDSSEDHRQITFGTRCLVPTSIPGNKGTSPSERGGKSHTKLGKISVIFMEWGLNKFSSVYK